jgi:hypothetical protein
MGLSGLFRSPCFPLRLSVESRVLEIVGSESGTALIMGDFFHRELLWFGTGSDASSSLMVLSRWTRRSGSRGT